MYNSGKRYFRVKSKVSRPKFSHKFVPITSNRKKEIRNDNQGELACLWDRWKMKYINGCVLNQPDMIILKGA